MREHPLKGLSGSVELVSTFCSCAAHLSADRHLIGRWFESHRHRHCWWSLTDQCAQDASGTATICCHLLCTCLPRERWGAPARPREHFLALDLVTHTKSLSRMPMKR